MNLIQLQHFFMWCTIVSLGMYVLTAVSIFVFRGFVLAMHKRLFNMNESAVDRAMHRYLGNFKLLIIIFCLVPWVAIMMMR